MNLNWSNFSGQEEISEAPYIHPAVYFPLMPTLALLLNLFVIFLVAMEKSMAKVIRIVLVNLLAASVFVAVAIIAFHLYIFLLAVLPSLQPVDTICRITVWLTVAGGACRLSFMAEFAVVVYIMVKRGERAVRWKYLILGSFLVWILVIIENIGLLFQAALEINSVGNVKCSPHVPDTAIAYLLVVVYIVVFGILVYIITIGAPAIALYSIKKNSITGDTSALKALIKFGLFLLIGNSINSIGHFAPTIATAIPETKEMNVIEVVAGIIEAYVIFISLYPTPILIILYFKPIRKKVYERYFKWLTCYHLKKNRVIAIEVELMESSESSSKS